MVCLSMWPCDELAMCFTQSYYNPAFVTWHWDRLEQTPECRRKRLLKTDGWSEHFRDGTCSRVCASGRVVRLAAFSTCPAANPSRTRPRPWALPPSGCPGCGWLKTKPAWKPHVRHTHTHTHLHRSGQVRCKKSTHAFKKVNWDSTQTPKNNKKCSVGEPKHAGCKINKYSQCKWRKPHVFVSQIIHHHNNCTTACRRREPKRWQDDLVAPPCRPLAAVAVLVHAVFT